jgi:hypothetical protein
MRKIIPIALLSMAFAVLALNADYRDRIPNLSGNWYMNGDRQSPCEIRQRPGSNRALFINEHGDRAWGKVRGNRVWIPDWNNGEGQSGRVRGNRIVWPDGNYWSRGRVERNRVSNLAGTWYMNGDEDSPCAIRQARGSNRALFTNEHGDRAWGTVRGDRVWIPDWNNGEGQSGRVRGNRIVWPDGNYWSR